MVESDPNSFPKIDLFPTVSKVTHFLLDHLQHEGLSDHGSGPALDRALYDRPATYNFPTGSEGEYYGEVPEITGADLLPPEEVA